MAHFMLEFRFGVAKPIQRGNAIVSAAVLDVPDLGLQRDWQLHHTQNIALQELGC